MKRHGECDMCGWCCEYIAVDVRIRFPTWLGEDYAEAREMKTDGGLFEKTVDVRDPCQHLCDDKSCAIHDSKPQYCQDWPRGPEDVIGKPCTYWFELDDGRRVGGTRSPYPG